MLSDVGQDLVAVEPYQAHGAEVAGGPVLELPPHADRRGQQLGRDGMRS